MEYLNYAQLIIGPAGSGKSTYCKIIQDHAYNNKRIIKVINLDPAAEKFKYKCDLDIRELININDVMNKQKLGPNGALLYCMEYLYDHIDFLDDYFNNNGDNMYYLIDCPGQLELYSHSDIMKKITNYLKKKWFFNSFYFLFRLYFSTRTIKIYFWKCFITCNNDSNGITTFNNND